MALSFNDTLGNSILKAIRDHIDGFAGESALRIYGGTPPANANAGLSSNTLLASFSVRNPCANDPTGKALTIFTPADVTATAAGTATFFRIGKISQDGGTAMIQGSVSDAAGNGELKLNRVALTSGEPVSIVEIKFSL